MTGIDFGQLEAAISRTPAESLYRFAHDPVPLDTFVTHPTFLANPPLSPIQYDAVRHAERIYLPGTYEWLAENAETKETRQYWDPERNPVRTVNFLTLQWGKGGGKDHICRIISLRIAHLLLCLGNPQAYYEMPAQDTIHLLNVASSSKQASRAFFQPMRRAVTRHANWFEHMGVDVIEVARGPRRRTPSQTQALQDTIRFAHNIEAISGHSDAETQEGLNLMLGIADEIDAFKRRDELVRASVERESSRSAEGIIEMLRTSARTRFPTVFKNVYISWPRYKGSMIQVLTDGAKADNEAHGQASEEYASGPWATWDVNPRVPGKESFAKDYRDDPIMSAAKYECRPARALNPFFANQQAIEGCQVSVERQPIEVSYELQGNAWQPVYGFDEDLRAVRGAAYALHADLAISGDRAGMAMAHVQRYQEVEAEVELPGGRVSTVPEMRPIIKVDFVLSFEASTATIPPREIQIRWARQLVFELRRRHFNIRRVTFDQFQCFTGDVEICLLDGSTKTMAELEGSPPFWVYSLSNGRVVPGLCTRAWCTGQRDDMVEVELDNGEVVRCTGDHRWMLRDGTYRRADQLQPGDSLMPLYRRHRALSMDRPDAMYEQVWHPEPDGSGKRWRFTHSMVSHHCYGKLPPGWVTHHKNVDQFDNRPENLVQMTGAAHSALHAQMAEGRFSQLWRDPEWAAEHRRRISRAQSELQLGKFGREARRYRHDITFEDVRAAAEQVASGGALTWRAVGALLGCGQLPIYSRVREAGYSSWMEFKWSVQPRSGGAIRQAHCRERQAANHKVAAVRQAPPERVYDLRVEEYHNFALAAGVFVHNSADSMQILLSHGLEAERVSTDLDTGLWRTLRDVFAEDRIRMARREQVLDELLSLTRQPNGKIDHPPGGCFIGSTRVPLLDGRDVQLQELAGGEPVWVYGSDDQGHIVPALAVGRRTKQTRQLCDVVLDSGAVVRCTPEHLWRLRDGTYKEAQALTRADRLMSIRKKFDFNSGYELVRDIHGVQRWTHILVREHLDGRPLDSGEVSHHDNEVKTDNRPENLIRMDAAEHRAHHTRKRHREDPAYVRSLRAAQREYWSSSEARALQAEVARESNKRRSNLRQIHVERLELLRSVLDARSVGEAARRSGLHRNSAVSCLRLHGYRDWEDFKRRDGENHRVRFVELVELAEPVWVYDLEVDAHHNFALTAGVFVHNSKDEADALACAVAGAIMVGGEEEVDQFGMPVPAQLTTSGFHWAGEVGELPLGFDFPRTGFTAETPTAIQLDGMGRPVLTGQSMFGDEEDEFGMAYGGQQ